MPLCDGLLGSRQVGTKMASRLPVNRRALVLLFVMVAGCSRTPTAPTALPVAPTLLDPGPNAFVRQNDPATGCRQDPVWGYGFQVTLRWSQIRGARSYRVHMMHPNAFAPFLDELVDATQYELRRCTTVMGFEDGWQWKVRAVGSGGQEGEWSEARRLNFTPANIPDS